MNSYQSNPVICIGTCSLCGGRVVTPQVVHVLVNQAPHPPWCEGCGAKQVQPTHGPIVEMVGSPPKRSKDA